jgi:ureidoacrylate peracid hydrolase
MHKVSIPDELMARARLQRGGREHLFETLEMSKVAHVIVDLQVGFVAEGSPVEVPVTREMMGEVNAISKAVREGGGVNAFLRFTYDPDEPIKWSSNYTGYMTPPMMELTKDAFSRGATNWELYPELDLQPTDLIFDKTRYSGFIPGTCLMHDELQARGIDTLIITGTLTNCCCESTARDAMQMGYKIIFVSDANATLSDAEHNATLISMTTIFADVMDTRHLLGVIAKSSEPALALAS